MDFFTLDTIFGKRFYAFIIIHLGTRRIVQYNVTTNSTGLFIRQQIIDFSWTIEAAEDRDKKKTYLIHDQLTAFDQLDYKQFCITNVKISAYAPNMNAFAERFVRSIRNEAFDWFVLFNESQIRNIFKEYIDYYNRQRPHQGIEQQVPDGYEAQKEGKIVPKPILSGLCHHYERKVS